MTQIFVAKALIARPPICKHVAATATHLQPNFPTKYAAKGPENKKMMS